MVGKLIHHNFAGCQAVPTFQEYCCKLVTINVFILAKYAKERLILMLINAGKREKNVLYKPATKSLRHASRLK
jgi:hypothetical protein